MARKKVRLEYIENDTARRVTYKKRVRGVIKKTKELSVLCGVDACAVVYGPYERAPVVWPSSDVEAKRILDKYRAKPEIDQSQRRFNQQSYLKNSIAKAEERLVKLQRRNREMEIENIMGDLLSGKPLEQVAFSDLGDLLWVIDDKLRTIQHRIAVLEGGNNNNNNNNINNMNNDNAINENGALNVNVGEMLGGVGNVMGGERATWEMEAGPSHLPPGSGQPMNGDDWQFG